MPIIGRNPMMYANGMALRNYGNLNVLGLLSRLGNGIKNFNWRGVLSGMNKTLNVVNQTIPLVKQARPMFDNVKSMVLLTKAFRNETKNDNSKKHNINNVNNNMLYKNNNYQMKTVSNNINSNTINRPIFFI